MPLGLGKRRLQFTYLAALFQVVFEVPIPPANDS